MLDGMDHVTKAAHILATDGARLRERLQKASAEFFVALLQEDEWPTRLWAKACTLRDQLRAQPLSHVDDRTAQALANSLYELAGEVQGAFFEENRKDWRRTVGMFADDETMKRIQDAGRRIREAERRVAKRRGKKPGRKVKK